MEEGIRNMNDDGQGQRKRTMGEFPEERNDPQDELRDLSTKSPIYPRVCLSRFLWQFRSQVRNRIHLEG